MSKKKKKKKEKVIWYDDGSTIADMSNVTKIGQKTSPQKPQPQPRRVSTAKEKWRTYWKAVKMMLMPMCVVLLVLLIIAVLYLLLMLII